MGSAGAAASHVTSRFSWYTLLRFKHLSVFASKMSNHSKVILHAPGTWSSAIEPTSAVVPSCSSTQPSEISGTVPFSSATHDSRISPDRRSSTNPGHGRTTIANISKRRQETSAAEPQRPIWELSILGDSLQRSIAPTWAQYNRGKSTWAIFEHGTASRNNKKNDNRYSLDEKLVRQVKVNVAWRTFVWLIQNCYHVPASTACDLIRGHKGIRSSFYSSFFSSVVGPAIRWPFSACWLSRIMAPSCFWLS